ncbi:dual specificity protein kinase pom1 [Rhypophila decipiens]|uniref:Dual specificity protein kinase pom1 n=1 Tax=Rhypophila decipiens TaxID=261697 RepID=A0AAN6YMW3_9PEZI|nr:dual specificity protein kinase pom1 [Rhypophila decipiens]
MLSASSSNNHSLFSFGGRNGASNEEVDATSTSFDFLPSVSFDDLQSSLESASTDFKLTQFPSPNDQPGQQSIATMVERADMTKHGVSNQAALQSQQQPPTRPGRSGSILRRPSNSSRQVSLSSTTSSNSGAPSNAPTAPAAMRPRRQSHYPPVSNSNIVKPPRKSVGPGVFDAGDFESRKRRPSVTSERGGIESTRSSIDGGSRPMIGDAVRNLTGSRASKAKSVQPPPRTSQSTLFPPDATQTPDQNRSSLAFPRSPRTAVKVGSNGSLGKRMSIMPGVPHASHATGLGARTISPTDTRRMKRLSMHQTQTQPPPPAQMSINPLPLAPEIRASSRSPSMLPRKISTPSSSRTTPDPNRKSYSSGLSVNSTNSFNTVRSSTGSIQPRVPQSASSSRLPAPKSLNLHPATNTEDDEDVPPVPAIPKVYESPKDSPAELSFLEKRKSNMAFDASSLTSTSTGSISGAQLNDPPPPPAKVQRRPSNRKTVHTSSKLDMEKKTAGPQVKKNLQPLRLPPITLGPLSTPTAAKIAALQEHGYSERNLSPPPARQAAKTPTTPMTASKTSFFNAGKAEERSTVQHLRSSSSVHRVNRRESPTAVDPTSSTESITAVKNGPQRSGMSPFLSSSVPKGGNMESSFLKRSRTGADFTVPPEPSADQPTQQHNKPSGPRAAPKAIATKQPPSKSPAPLPSPDEPPTPSSISSLRRKLSLSWKRSASKGSSSHLPGDSGSHVNTHHDSMPPPRIPVSATLNSLSTSKPPSPTPSTRSSATGTYLESRRRKSSASSLNAIIAQERKRSDSLIAAKKESTLDTVVERSSLYNGSVVQKILKPKGSTATLRHQDIWTSDLDKDDLVAEEEMRKLGSRRKETELAARTLDALRKRATAKERVSPQEAIRIAVLNIHEKGEIFDFNDIYFCGTQNAAKVVGNPQSEKPNDGYDDERGDYTIVPGDHLAYRYEIIDVLGKGSFGQVVRCIDHKTGILVAVKIIRNKKRFHAQAIVEVDILKKLREWDPKNKYSMVNFTHSFHFRQHLCIATELLDMNLYEFIKSNAFRGFSLKLIRRFTKQLLSSLNLLKQHKVIHCDLKPENILLRHPLHSEIKVIDFGSSCFENEKVYTYIQSRFYRSPEVILGMTYGMPIDMWSLGCILAELYTGVPIFPGENEQEQLACIMEVFGPPEKHLIEKSTRKKLFFDSMGKPRLTVSSKGRRRRPSSKTLQQVLKCDDEPFLDFLTKCLRWDPDRRMKPDEAIRHEFITGQKTSMPLPSNRARESSPSKRVPSYNSISNPRPLPDPPTAAGTSARGNTSLRPREATGVSHSPMKAGGGGGGSNAGSRRVSGVSASSTAPNIGTSGGGLKRTNTNAGHSVGGASISGGQGSFSTNGVGATSASIATNGAVNGSSLPRASIRSVSAKHYGSSTISSSQHSQIHQAQSAQVHGQTQQEKDMGAAMAGANAAMGNVGASGSGTFGRR